ncbi:MAG: hypothetical protein GY827_04035 [Cytophagales bacterium]|nr:hypothetical protein [Cytophagales bacterium]
MANIKIERRGWSDTFSQREAVLFLESLDNQTLTQYIIDYHGESLNGESFLERVKKEEYKTVQPAQKDFIIVQNEAGALFFENQDLSIQISRKQFQEMLQKNYLEKLTVQEEKAIQFYQSQLF